MPFLFLEFLGTSEMLIIALVALIVFGPRKLPELGRSLGKSIGEFKRASEDFKRTWEREVDVERIERDLRIEQEVGAAISAPSASSAPSALPDAEDSQLAGGQAAETEQSIARTSSREAVPETASPDAAEEPAAARADRVEPADKQDWL